MTPAIRQNIRDMGKYCIQKYEELMKELPGVVIRVNGTGLLYQVKLDPKIEVTAMDGVEMILRMRCVSLQTLTSPKKRSTCRWHMCAMCSSRSWAARDLRASSEDKGVSLDPLATRCGLVGSDGVSLAG